MLRTLSFQLSDVLVQARVNVNPITSSFSSWTWPYPVTGPEAEWNMEGLQVHHRPLFKNFLTNKWIKQQAKSICTMQSEIVGKFRLLISRRDMSFSLYKAKMGLPFSWKEFLLQLRKREGGSAWIWWLVWQVLFGGFSMVSMYQCNIWISVNHFDIDVNN